MCFIIYHSIFISNTPIMLLYFILNYFILSPLFSYLVLLMFMKIYVYLIFFNIVISCFINLFRYSFATHYSFGMRFSCHPFGENNICICLVSVFHFLFYILQKLVKKSCRGGEEKYRGQKCVTVLCSATEFIFVSFEHFIPSQ